MQVRHVLSGFTLHEIQCDLKLYEPPVPDAQYELAELLPEHFLDKPRTIEPMVSGQTGFFQNRLQET